MIDVKYSLDKPLKIFSNSNFVMGLVVPDGTAGNLLSQVQLIASISDAKKTPKAKRLISAV